MKPATQLTYVLAMLCVGATLFPMRGLAQELPVPAGAELEEALRVVKDVFGDEYDAAKSNLQKQNLVRKMLDTVAGTKDPVDRFALLQAAREIATTAGDGAGAFRAVDVMSRSFRIDAVRMKAAVLDDLSRKALTAAQYKSVAEQSFRLADEAIRGDDVHTASRLAQMALAGSRKARDSQLAKQIVVWKREFDEVVQLYEKAKLGLERLETDPSDVTANLDVGRYACFVKGDWNAGLMMLALGGDTQLKQIAVREIGPPLPTAEQVEIGDAWWELAEKADGLVETALYARAAFHYRLAARQSTGLLAAKLNRRLAELAEENAEALRDASQMARRPAPAAPRPAPAAPRPARTEPLAVATVAKPPSVPPVRETPAAEVPAPQMSPPTETRPAETRPADVEPASRTVTIPANSAKGYVIGPTKKGTTITLQYIGGKWKSWGSQADISPDKTGGRGGTMCLLTIAAFEHDGKTSQLLTQVPQGTKATPFVYQVPQDVPLLVLRIKGKGNKWSGNPGKVQYKLGITPPR